MDEGEYNHQLLPTISTKLDFHLANEKAVFENLFVVHFYLRNLNNLFIMRYLMLIFIIMMMSSFNFSMAENDDDFYRNPIINQSLPDPSIIKADDGFFYLYATENTRNVPIYRSRDLVEWSFVGTAFTEQTRPQWNSQANIWANKSKSRFSYKK